MVVPTSQESTAHSPSPGSPAGGPPASLIEGWESYAQLALSTLKLELYESGDGLMVVQEPELGPEHKPTATPSPAVPPPRAGSPRKRWTGGLRKLLRRRKPAENSQIVREAATPAELLTWLFDRLAKEDQLLGLVPTDDPRTVHELTERLFSAYEVDGGSLHLGGCHLESVPFLRLTSRAGTSTGANPSLGDHANETAPQEDDDPLQVVHAFFDAAGKPVDAALVRKLKLAEVDLPIDPQPACQRADWSAAISTAKEALGGDQPSASAAVAIVCAKRAKGQIQATIGDESLAIEFEGWTRTLRAAPAVCPLTGVRTFHLTALSDGRIAAASEVIRCEESGETVLHRDCVRCSVTGKTVKAELCEPCPVSGDPALPAEFAACPRCGQQVSRAVLTKSGCKGCDRLASAAKDDPRVVKLLAAAPKLAEQKRLRVAETETALIAGFGGLLSETIVVVGKQSGKVCHAARRGRLSSMWKMLNDEERTDLLGKL